jgi:hypothetical protein
LSAALAFIERQLISLRIERLKGQIRDMGLGVQGQWKIGITPDSTDPHGLIANGGPNIEIFRTLKNLCARVPLH